MDILLKCIGVWLLVLLQKENLSVLCTNDTSQSYSLATRDDNSQNKSNADLVNLFSSGNNAEELQKNTNQIELQGDSLVSSTRVTQKNGSLENIVHMEGGGGVTLYHDKRPDAGPAVSVPDLLSDSITVADHDNRSSGVVPRKGVTYRKPKIVPRKGVGTEGNSSGVSKSSIESSDENMEQNSDVLSKECICCLNNTSSVSIGNETDKNCTKCCNIMKNGRNTSSTVRNISNATVVVNQLPTNSAKPSAANFANHGSTWKNTSDSAAQDNTSSLNSTATSALTPARNKKPLFTLDAADDLAANLSLQSPSHNKSLNRTDYVIPVVFVILAVPLIIVLAVFLYKKGSEFWERRHYRRMDFLIDGMYNE
jgi:hypothetical protein